MQAFREHSSHTGAARAHKIYLRHLRMHDQHHNLGATRSLRPSAGQPGCRQQRPAAAAACPHAAHSARRARTHRRRRVHAQRHAVA